MSHKLAHILDSIAVQNSNWERNATISKLSFDSRDVDENTLFFAIIGSTTDGHKYIKQVIESGCKHIVIQTNEEFDGVNVIRVKDTAEALSISAHNFYDKPSEKTKLIGITGTNGKTTTTTLLFNLFSQLGYKCGLISTVINKIGKEDIPATHTTPNPIALSELLDRMVKEECTYVFMEVSSHAIHQKRTMSLQFDIAAFTNITHDHLDYHKTFKEYLEVKKSFFDHLGPNAHALTNIDDKNGMVMLQNTKATKHTYALKTPADYKGKIIENELSGLILQINGTEVYTQLIGEFNAYNLLTVYGICELLGLDKLDILTQMSTLKSVDGRFEFFKSATNITCIVDYAHTPDALENVLKTIQSFKRGETKVISIVGCGGDRDRTKRPKMAQIANSLSDQSILTSDNPRTENPTTILEEMEAGITAEKLVSNLTVSDRKEAIKLGISLTKSGDVLLIAGKGHEKYQDINGTKYPFDDLAIAKDLFIKLKK
jgi:UDP-N-acetylmuramoyl-L-alanyl-D-glutamate--2,6-diaminopimelate ligase